MTTSPAGPDRQNLPIRNGNGCRLERQNLPLSLYKNTHLRIYINKYTQIRMRFEKQGEPTLDIGEYVCRKTDIVRYGQF
jgi:hypothetical protein